MFLKNCESVPHVSNPSLTLSEDLREQIIKYLRRHKKTNIINKRFD